MRFLRLDELGWDALAFAWGSHELMQGPAGLKRVETCRAVKRYTARFSRLWST